MTSTTKPRKSRYSDEQKAAYKDQKQAEQRELLERAVDALTSEEGWLRYLKTRSTFHNYSFNNTILIALQCPEATQVAGAKKWREEFNRTIIAGQKAITILAPMISYEKDKQGKFVLDANGKKIIRHIWFKGVPVFDVSQTEGDPVPEAPPLQPLTGTSHEEYLYRAEAWFQGNGYTVEYPVDMGDTRGSVDLLTNHVKVSGLMECNGQARTMIHELAHVIGDVNYTNYTRAQAEVIVESAAFIATQRIGLDTSGMSVPYIATWGADAEDPKAALKIIKEFAEFIDTVAERIIEAVS
jgi:hypothetical protein